MYDRITKKWPFIRDEGKRTTYERTTYERTTYWREAPASQECVNSNVSNYFAIGADLVPTRLHFGKRTIETKGCLQIPLLSKGFVTAAEHDLKMNMSLTSPFVACPCCYCSQLKAEAEHVDTFCIQWFPLRVRAACSQFRGPKRQPWVEDYANI